MKSSRENKWIMYKMKCIPEPLEPLMEAVKAKSLRAGDSSAPATDIKPVVVPPKATINSSVKLENAVTVPTKCENRADNQASKIGNPMLILSERAVE